jgi:hypothetical protein
MRLFLIEHSRVLTEDSSTPQTIASLWFAPLGMTFIKN